MAPPTSVKENGAILHFPCSGLSSQCYPGSCAAPGQCEEVSTWGWLQNRVGAPTRADEGRQSSESTLNEQHEWALSMAKESAQQYHLLWGKKGQRTGTESSALHSLGKTTTWVPTMPRQLEQARPEHEKPNNVSYTVSVTTGGNQSAKPPQNCLISSTSGCPVQPCHVPNSAPHVSRLRH